MAARTPRTILLYVGVLVLLASLSYTVFQVWSDYRETMTRQEVTARDIVRVVAAQAVGTVQQADIVIGMVSEMVVAEGGVDSLRDPAHMRRLGAYCLSLNGCVTLAVVAPDGRVAVNSSQPGPLTIRVDDREYFREAVRKDALFVGPALRARIAGNAVRFPIARAVRDSAGRLLGVVVAGMDTRHLTDFYGLLGFNVNPTVTVFKSNGDLVARHPDMGKYVGRNFADGPLFAVQLPKAPAGTYRSKSVFDGRLRIASYQSLPELGIVVFAGIELDRAFENWHARTWRTVLASLAWLACVFAVLGWGYLLLERDLALRNRNSELDRLSHSDALTGIANRRAFDLLLEAAWARHRAERKPLAVLMIDVDCFKPYNDNYGHQAGDECLRRVAAALRDALHRNVDSVARYGGEEFVVLLDADAAGAAAVAERMRAAVQKLGIPHAHSSAGEVVTISVGVACVQPSGGDAGAIVRLADAALYRAKEAGRNRVGVEADAQPETA